MPYTDSYTLDNAKQLLSSGSFQPSPTPSLLQDLVQLQHQFGFINAESTHWLGQQYQLTSSYIKGIIDFYHFLHSEFTGQYLIYLSNNITDQMKGAARCFKQFTQALSLDSPNTLANISYSSCTGLGDQGPAGLINGYPVTNLTEDRVNEIISLIQQQKPLSEWPTAFFNVEDNIRKTGPLLNHSIKPGSILSKIIKQHHAQPSLFIDTITQSGLRGRGGAGFSTGAKWAACHQAEGDQKVIICNADEGEPGTFKDRVLLTSYLDNIIEGMTICAYTVGAQEGYIYLRGEYMY
ncbi:MAG: NAD(P)H-dependent oxidoreductase subunit E, partial [Pseudomonadales bacterium]|nr:NAD(P)H-dependent oxidoreductase subunit E [Pseudomonadales bacterium]